MQAEQSLSTYRQMATQSRDAGKGIHRCTSSLVSLMWRRKSCRVRHRRAARRSEQGSRRHGGILHWRARTPRFGTGW